MARKMVPHGFMIDSGQFKILRRLAFEREITMSQVVRLALDEFFKKQTKRGK